MKWLATLLFFFHSLNSLCQVLENGILSGNVLTGNKHPVADASVQLYRMHDSVNVSGTVTDRTGAFHLAGIPEGFYTLKLSSVGFQTIKIDSLHFRNSRADFNLPNLILKPGTSQELATVTIYREKALVESSGGNITYNASESALSAGSNASDLLTNVPLISKDANGRLLVRGKEPKVLIDDKPVELNQQQLQDLLESLPGSSIEKIEVMTNPPPQYANEPGGVINIVTRKGNIGRSGRLNVSAGTRGEMSANGNYTYRKAGFVLSVNGGVAYNKFYGSGNSYRQNNYGSYLRLDTRNQSRNGAARPNGRVSLDYDLDKRRSLSATISYNGNNFDNTNETQYTRFAAVDSFVSASRRYVQSDGRSINPNTTVSYTGRAKKGGAVLKVIAGLNHSMNDNDRTFYEQFLRPDFTLNGLDSAQEIQTLNTSSSNNLRLNYDVPSRNKKTTISTGAFYNASRSHLVSGAMYRGRADGKWQVLDALTNDLIYKQHLFHYRASFKHVFKNSVVTTGGLSAENTRVFFRIPFSSETNGNDYWNLLPYGTLSRSWTELLNLTLSYRKTVRRPGVNELTPIKDVSDSNNIRSGNPLLLPSVTHSFDLIAGKTTKRYFVNFGLGYNSIKDIYYSIRVTPTETMWQNISGKKEYELSVWSGISLAKRTKLNGSASYTRNRYSHFDKTVRRFRDGGSFTGNLSLNQTLKDRYTASGSFAFNRFANPQGSVRSTGSMNFGFSAKMLEKRMTLTVNAIDLFRHARNSVVTYGSNFIFENVNTTITRNIRLTAAYNLVKSKVKKPTPSPGKKSSAPGQKVPTVPKH